MVRGLGIDLCAIDEMETRLSDPASQFLALHFTPGEMRDIRGRGSEQPGQHAAGRYAAKEACIKALSQAAGGRAMVGALDYREIEIVAAEAKPPAIHLQGKLLEAARELGLQRISLSMTHEGNLAAAVVVIE